MRQPSNAFTLGFFCLVLVLVSYAIGKDLVLGVHWRIPLYITAFVLYAFGFFRVKSLSNWSRIGLSLMVLGAAIGESLFGLYYTTVWYDKVLHFVFPFLLVFMFFDLFSKKRSFWSVRKRIVVSSFASFLIGGLLWEAVEIFLYLVFDVPLVGVVLVDPSNPSVTQDLGFWLSPLMDSLYDVILDILGVLLGFFVLLKVHKEKIRS